MSRLREFLEDYGLLVCALAVVVACGALLIWLAVHETGCNPHYVRVRTEEGASVWVLGADKPCGLGRGATYPSVNVWMPRR